MAQAPIDDNSVKGLIATSSADGKTPVKVWADPASHRLLVDSLGGTIVGPGSSTDNAVVRWDGTTGDTIQDSSVTISDGGNITTNGNILRFASGNGVQGSNTNGSVSAGYVGEFVSSYKASGSPVALSTNTPANMTSISLTAGDWDVEGNVNFSLTGATTTAFQAGLSSTSATLPTDGSECYSAVVTTILTDTETIELTLKRFSLSGTTTIYAVATATFSVGSIGVFGGLTARRIR